jgi:uncharacterized protein
MINLHLSRRSTLAVAAALLFTIGNALAQPAATVDKTKAENIRTLLNLTKSAQMGQKIMDEMVGSYRKALPSVPAAFWDTLSKDLSGDLDRLSGLLIPVYDRHFTNNEIKDLIVFYKTPTGTKLLTEQVGIMQESLSIGELWGRGIADKVKKRLEARKYVK